MSICNICHNEKDNKQVQTGVYGDPNVNGFKCGSCHHLFIHPLMEESEESSFYTKEYPIFLHQRGDSKNQSAEKHFSMNFSEGKRRRSDIEKYLNKNQTVLELGSATGFFLNEIKPLVKEVIGVEPNIDHSRYANEMGVRTFNSLEEILPGSCDVIFSYYVLEHIRTPEGFLKALLSKLKPNGLLITEVPNGNEALMDMYQNKAYKDFCWQKAHVSYFTKDTLTLLNKKVGLETEMIPVQRYDISNHLNWLMNGKPGGAGKFASILDEKLNQEYHRCLKEKWLCDSLLSISVKK
jgi:SAM-dependent methyltransferase